MRRTFAALSIAGILTILLAWPAPAGDFGLTDPSRWSISGSAAWLGFKDYGSGETQWQGLDLAPGLTFSAHERLALAGNFSHGIPFESEAGHRNMARVQGQLRLYPPVGIESNAGLFASAGPMWMGGKSLREWRGLNTQLSAIHSFNDHLSGFVMYAHAFALAGAEDRDFFRVGLNAGTPFGR